MAAQRWVLGWRRRLDEWRLVGIDVSDSVLKFFPFQASQRFNVDLKKLVVKIEILRFVLVQLREFSR